MNIFLVRHGQSVANVDKEIHVKTADHAIALSDRGERQADAAGKFLAEYFEHQSWYSPATDDNQMKPDPYIGKYEHIRMWVSPYKRTRQTAAILHAACPRINDSRENIRLVEQQFGLFDGISHEGTSNEIKRKFPDEYEHYKKCEDFEGKFWARMPLGESRFDVCNRVHEMFGTLHRDYAKHGINNLVVVAHGLSNRAFTMEWLHLPFEWFEAEKNPANCSIRFIQDNEDKGYIYEGGTE